MAQDFMVNGRRLDYIQQGEWQEQNEGSILDGQAVHNRWRQHILKTNVSTVNEFHDLFDLLGQKVTLTTVDYDDRNGDYKTYYGAEFQRIDEQQQAQHMTSLQCEFLVRL